jgi:hypothetical protein
VFSIAAAYWPSREVVATQSLGVLRDKRGILSWNPSIIFYNITKNSAILLDLRPSKYIALLREATS